MADEILILCPVTSDDPYRIVPGGSGSGFMGAICVFGRVSTQERNGAGSGTAPSGVTVFVHVFNGHLLEAHIPTDPPPECLSVAPSGSNWAVGGVPVPDSSGSGTGSGPGAPLTVVAWEVGDVGSGPATLARNSQRVFGIVGDGVDCCTGSGSGANPMVIPQVDGARAAVALAPAKWSLPAVGLPAPFDDAPGGGWQLSMRDAACWDNGGDGVGAPRVELRCDGPPRALWRLRLRYNGVACEYTAPAAWFALAPLTLAATDAGGFPATVTTTPA